MQDGIVTCNSCNFITLEFCCVKDDKLKFVLYNKNNNVRVNLLVPLQLLQSVSKKFNAK